MEKIIIEFEKVGKDYDFKLDVGKGIDTLTALGVLELAKLDVMAQSTQGKNKNLKGA